MTRTRASVERRLATARALLRERDALVDACARRVGQTPHDSRDRSLVVLAMEVVVRDWREAREALRVAESEALLAEYETLTGHPWGEPLDVDRIRREVASTTARIRRETDAELGEHSLGKKITREAAGASPATPACGVGASGRPRGPVLQASEEGRAEVSGAAACQLPGGKRP